MSTSKRSAKLGYRDPFTRPNIYEQVHIKQYNTPLLMETAPPHMPKINIINDMPEVKVDDYPRVKVVDEVPEVVPEILPTSTQQFEMIVDQPLTTGIMVDDGKTIEEIKIVEASSITPKLFESTDFSAVTFFILLLILAGAYFFMKDE